MRPIRPPRPVLPIALCLALAPVFACARAPSDEPAVGPEPGASVAAEREPSNPSQVESDEIQPNEEIEAVLAGRVSGVRVERSGDGIIVRIRGRSTIMGNVHPLYVVDGLPVEPAPDGSIPILPYDIESIRVLKDASSTTMYGVRGANGVIVIVTKRP